MQWQSAVKYECARSRSGALAHTAHGARAHTINKYYEFLELNGTNKFIYIYFLLALCFVVFMHPIPSSRSIRFSVSFFIFRSSDFFSSAFRMYGSATLHTEALLTSATCIMYIYRPSVSVRLAFEIKNCTDNANFTNQTSWEWRSSGARKMYINTKPAWCMKTFRLLVFRLHEKSLVFRVR